MINKANKWDFILKVAFDRLSIQIEPIKKYNNSKQQVIQ